MDLTQSSRNQFKAAADPCRGARDVHPFFQSNFFNFMQFLGKMAKIIGFHPLLLRLVAPLQNPGSALPGI